MAQYFLRWLAVLPAAVSAALLANFIFRIFYGWIFPFFVGADPDSLLSRFVLTVTADTAMGAIFVYAAGAVAPRHQIRVALASAAFVLIFGVIGIFLAVTVRDYEAIFSGMCICGGGVLAAFSIRSAGVTKSQ